MNKFHALSLAAALAVTLAIPVAVSAQPTDAAAEQQRRDAEHAREQAHRRDQENRRDEENRRDAEHRQDAEKRRDEENQRDAEHRQDAERRRDAQRQRAPGRQDALHRQDDGRGRGAALSADDMIGHRVTNRHDRRKVGEVTDLVVDEQGQIEAAIVRTGGIFGLFTKDVLVPWAQLEQSTDDDGSTLLINMDKQALRRAPAYTRD